MTVRVMDLPSDELRLEVVNAIGGRLRRARREIAAAAAPDRATGLSLADAAERSAAQARRHWEETDAAAKETERLLADGRLEDAVRTAEWTARPAARAAQWEARVASDAAEALQAHADAAAAAVGQAQRLVSLASQPEWEAGAAWTARLVAQVMTVAELAERLQAEARDAAYEALDAAATCVQADVSLERVKGNLNRVKESRNLHGPVVADKSNANQSAIGVVAPGCGKSARWDSPKGAAMGLPPSSAMVSAPDAAGRGMAAPPGPASAAPAAYPGPEGL